MYEAVKNIFPEAVYYPDGKDHKHPVTEKKRPDTYRLQL